MRSVQDIDRDANLKGPFYPSPAAWEDQALYFLLVDRFSDGNEHGYGNNAGDTVESGDTPLFEANRDAENAAHNPDVLRQWACSGGGWCGGNLRGAATKLGYLKRLGITALWISPVLKQAAHASDCYHGYGTQNFLDIDPHFGTPDDLRSLVATAHSLEMYVILDVIFNHTADVFAYADVADQSEVIWRPEPYPVAGFRDAAGQPTLPFGPVDEERFPDAYPNGAVWPRELQLPECFTRQGRIQNWDNIPEFHSGDFFGFKDIHLGSGSGEAFVPSSALLTLIEVYKYWIAYADLDGFRVDTVKHMPAESVAYFAREIRSFAESIGKRNFYLIGEIVGDRKIICDQIDRTQLNAALGIGEIPQKIRQIVVGREAPANYFDLFVNSRKEGEACEDAVWWRERVVTFFDDHDQVGKDIKGRLAGEWGSDRQAAEKGVLRAVFFQLMTLGIPCLYYGTEQGFEGQAEAALVEILSQAQPIANAAPVSTDRFIRETMFGGRFGAFRSQRRHFFREDARLYREIAALLELRRRHAVLRRGRQYLRELSTDGQEFWLPVPGEEPYQGIIAWSRLLDVDTFLCAVNTDPLQAHSVWVTLDADRHRPGGDGLTCLYSTDSAQIGLMTSLPEERNGSAVWLNVPPGGAVLYR